MKIDLPFSKLKTFYYVASKRSFKEAASSLSVTEGAVSQAIKDLESRLEAKLLERSNRNVRLTQRGKDLLSIVSSSIENLDNVFEEFERIKGKITGKVRIASFEAMLLQVFPSCLERFQRFYPECEILLYNSWGKQIHSMVLSGDIDFAIGSVRSLPDGIKGKELWRFDRYLIAPIDHPISKKKRLSLRDIADFSCVMPTEGAGSESVPNKLKSINPNLKITVEAGSWHVVKQYVEMGFGISFLPGITIEDSDLSRFYLKPISNLIGISQYGILVKKGKYISPAARELINLFISISEGNKK